MNRYEKYCRPCFFLTLSVLVGAAALSVYLCHSVHIYNDVAFCYAYAIREAAVYGNWEYVLDPGLPVLNMAASTLVALTGVEAFRAFMLVGGLFYILSVFPLYFLLKRFVPPLAASLGCLIFALTPKIMRFSCSGLMESARDFFFISSLLLLFSLTDRKTFGKAVLFALSLAGLALARVESVVISVVFIALLFADDIWRQRRSLTAGKVVKSLLFCGVIGALLVIFISPKLIYNYRKTGYPTLDTRYNPYFDALLHWNRHITLPPDYPPPGKVSRNANAYDKTGKFTWLSNFSSVFNNMMRGGYELYFALAALGVLFCVCRPLRRVYAYFKIPIPPLVQQGWRREYTMFVILTIAHCILYFANCSAYRYYTFIVPMLIPGVLITLHLAINLVKIAPRKYHLPHLLVLAGISIAAAHIDNGLAAAFTGREEWDMGCFLRDHADSFRAPGAKRRIRVFNRHVRPCFFSGFEYANSSLNNKSKALTDREGDFDLAVFEADIEAPELKAWVEKYDLAEWLEHPCPKDMKIFVPRRRARH